MALRDVRKTAHLTQTELADLSTVDQSSISAIESGRTKVPLWTTLEDLADALSKRLGRTVTPAEIAPRRGPRLLRGRR